jgi:hypothetical protein
MPAQLIIRDQSSSRPGSDVAAVLAADLEERLGDLLEAASS